jgi:hypothetical protein
MARDTPLQLSTEARHIVRLHSSPCEEPAFQLTGISASWPRCRCLNFPVYRYHPKRYYRLSLNETGLPPEKAENPQALLRFPGNLNREKLREATPLFHPEPVDKHAVKSPKCLNAKPSFE